MLFRSTSLNTPNSKTSRATNTTPNLYTPRDKMGHKIYPPPDYYPPGIDCYGCTPTLYESGSWPSRLYAFFTEMTACPGHAPPPNNHFFQLVQSGSGCIFSTIETIGSQRYYCQLNIASAQLYLIREKPLPGSIFMCNTNPCSLIFPTNEYSCPMHAAEGGSAIITDSPTPLTSYLCGSCHLTPHQSTWSETQLVAIDHALIRLANLNGKTCIYVYLDQEDIQF